MLKIYLGKDESGNPVHWIPKKEKNPHFMVVGTSGSGKTETLKAVAHELHENKIPSLIIDFHQDFEEVPGYVMDFSNITINPLEYGSEPPETVMYKISHILKKIFNLGVQQEGILQDAIQKSYRDKGIDIKSTEPKDPPTFEDVKNILEESTDKLREEKRSIQTIETLLVRLRPLFNTGFFSNKKSSIPFSQIFKKTTILRLKNMPTEEVKYAVAEFFINKLRYELYSRGKSDNIVLYCIVDEAHRLIDERSPLNDLLRESRKYGTGVILSSQRPSDFSDTVLANLGGILSFQCRLDRDAIFVARQMGMNFELIKGLTEIGTGYVNFSSEKANRKIKIVPVWERKPEIKKEKPKEKKENVREEKKDIVVEKRLQKRIISESEKITLIEGRKTSPLLAWLFAGFRTCFSDARISAAATAAAILILWSLSYVYWIAFFIALISILIIVGKYRG